MRMDRYEDENKNNEEKTTRLNKNKELYEDVYLNNAYVDIDKLTDVVNLNNVSDNKEEIKKVKEINLSEYSTYEDKEYDIVKLVEEAINNKDNVSETANKGYDFESKEAEIKNVIDSINEKAIEEKKAHEDDELMAELLPTKENTDILPALEPLPDTTNVIDHLNAPITDTSILKLPENTAPQESLDMLSDISDDDLETDDSFVDKKSHKYIKLIVILIIIFIIGAGVLVLKLLDLI